MWRLALSMAYRTSPADLKGMPPGVPHIIGNEAAERFSFYGMKAVLAVFMVQYLHLMDGPSSGGINQAQATENVHLFNTAVYITPVLGAFLADFIWGKYRTIIALSLVYCMGHGALALMGTAGYSPIWLMMGLGLIALGSGGIKPCVSAHVGDQFGARNADLLPRVFNWFYFSINLGAFVSSLLTPWLLNWYGPHWAFGVPGVLMALATLVFWMGRKRFIHVPANRHSFVNELSHWRGRLTLLKLIPLYIFVAMFWALFDQTSTRFVFQAMDMDLNFMSVEWLPSQLQSLNALFILTFIPLFAYVLYPLVSRVWRLTPLRKIGVGLFLMVLSFSLAALVQEWIDAGQQPNIYWQIIVIALLTAAEVMVSIVALEFAYTQSPKSMKSLVMCFYLGSVAVGNFFVSGVNHFIQVPSAALEQFEESIAKLPSDWRSSPRTVVLPGYDGTTGTEDDLIQRVKEGRPSEVEIPGGDVFAKVIAEIEQMPSVADGQLPAEEAVMKSIDDLRDPWGGEVRYEILNSRTARLISDGPDKKAQTQWDVGMMISLKEKDTGEVEKKWTDAFHPEKTWLDRRKEELGMKDDKVSVSDESSFLSESFSGGQTRLDGADYFWFFTWMMLGTAILFIPYAVLYRGDTVLQD